MNSVSFPAHVVVILRRLVNVVSTLSISNQYLLHQQTLTKSEELPNLNNPNGLKQSLDCLKDVEWPWWTVRSNWELRLGSIDTRRQIHNPELLLKSTIGLPNWFPDPGNWTWPHMFSFFQLEVSDPQPSTNPPPPPSPERPRRENHDKEQQKSPPKDPVELPRQETKVTPSDIIHQLLVNPALYDPLLTPRYPIVLCHGLYGFDSRGPTSFPSMRMHYWSNVLRILRGKVGAEVIVTSVPGTGSIQSRAARLDEQLQSHARGRGINFLAHSMGGLDCRHLISRIRPAEYAPLSLTCISTPHRGSPFMDWCAANIGIGKLRQQEKELAETLGRDMQAFSAEETFVPPFTSQHDAAARPPSPVASEAKEESSSLPFSLSLSSLPSSFATLLLSIVDSPAYANLTSKYLNNVFNPNTPDDPDVKYWSVAGRMSAGNVSVWHPFWLPKMVLDGVEEAQREKLKKLWEKASGDQNWGEYDIPLWANEKEWGNDGLVTVQSAKWGEFLGIMEGCDHWEMRGARGIEFGVDLPAIPAIGLGSVLPTSIRRAVSDTPSTAQGDGWGFGDWTRFVGAWKKSRSEAATRDKHKTRTESQDHARDQQTSLSSSLPQSQSQPQLQPQKHETPNEKRARERSADDEVVRSSTDTLSAVFDWLIERVPAPKRMLGVGSIGSVNGAGNGRSEGKATMTEKEQDLGVGMKFESLEKQEKEFTSPGRDEKELGMLAVTYSVSHGVGSGAGASASASANSSSTSEVKRRMDREKAKLKKRNELGSKDDLERFYVALTRKMYDEGL
ncbi:alpha/beta-hydrolase [Phlegmacium glaucopus]|nr:alpha/beta-hydrolase [Phlegmacium glaucopus]